VPSLSPDKSLVRCALGPVFDWQEFEFCTGLVLPPGTDRRDASVSPLYASHAALATMPPALFTCGNPATHPTTAHHPSLPLPPKPPPTEPPDRHRATTTRVRHALGTTTAAERRGRVGASVGTGTDDALIDDTLFMASRWASAGAGAELAIWPGGAHVRSAGLNPRLLSCPDGPTASLHMCFCSPLLTVRLTGRDALIAGCRPLRTARQDRPRTACARPHRGVPRAPRGRRGSVSARHRRFPP
jgi:hypothetical protein